MKISELTTKVNSYEVTDPTKQVSADEYNTILQTVQEHDVTLPKTVAKVEELDDKAITTENIEDSIKDLSVKDLTGVIETTPEEFNFRPSAGDKSIRDESAVIRSIKGNSLVINNCLRYNIGQNGYFLTKYDDGSFLVKRNPEVTSNVYFSDFWKTGSTVKGHKYAIFVYYTASNILEGEKLPIYIYGPTTTQYGPVIKENGSGVATVIITCDSVVQTNIINYSPSNNQELLVKKRAVIDLTKMFGVGKEPATIEEFYARIPQGIDIYSYNEDQIINNNVEGIKTVGFNQWDEQWELGNISPLIGDNKTASNSIRSKDYIPIIGGQSYYFYKGDGGEMGVFAYDSNYNFIGVYIENTFTPSVGTLNITNKSIALPSNARYIKFRVFPIASPTYNNDICINLSHSGIRNGEYEPYKENYRALPDIKKYFPDGMKSAGSVYDEITSEKAIQRVGVRAYVDGDESDISVTTDGTNTNYAIPEPIETPLEEPIQLDYVVEDWGTEEAISDEPSAPFKADIVYQFNAEGRIRDNNRNIEILANMVRILQEKVRELETLLTTADENIEENVTVVE